MAPGKQIQQINEPVRKSLFDMIHDNFKLANRHIYVNRLFYIGKHTFADAMGENVCDFFHQIVTDINSKYCDESLTGFLLYYPQFFCHVIEGSEDSIHKHLRRVIKEPRFGTCKIICVYHHINQRFISNWTYITAKPATLLEKMDPDSNLENTNSKIIYCLQKLYKLGNVLRKQEAYRKTTDASASSMAGNSTVFLLSESNPKDRKIITPDSKIRESIMSSVAPEPTEQVTSACLPEYTVLDFLIETRYTQRLIDYSKSFGTLPTLEEYRDLVWPIASDGIPKDVFDKEFDPINDLPDIKGDAEAEIIANSDIVQ